MKLKTVFSFLYLNIKIQQSDRFGVAEVLKSGVWVKSLESENRDNCMTVQSHRHSATE